MLVEFPASNLLLQAHLLLADQVGHTNQLRLVGNLVPALTQSPLTLGSAVPTLVGRRGPGTVQVCTLGRVNFYKNVKFKKQ